MALSFALLIMLTTCVANFRFFSLLHCLEVILLDVEPIIDWKSTSTGILWTCTRTKPEAHSPPTKILLVCNMIQAYMLIKGYRNVFILFYIKRSKALISALQSAHLVRGLLWLTRLVSSLDNRVYAEYHIELTWNACSPTLLPASLRGRNAWWPPWNCCIELMVWPLGYGT